MVRLGSVIGAILADVARARVVTDELTRDLAEVYRSDTVLASMSVPRLVVEQAELTLRFATTGVEEAEVTPTPDTPAIRDAWVRHAQEVVVPRLAARLGLPPDVFAGTVEAAVVPGGDRPTTGTQFERAVSGDPKPAAAATARAMSNVFDSLPEADRRRLKTKTAIRNAVQQELESALRAFVGREVEVSSLRQVLASRIDVEVRSQTLPTQPSQVQELRLVVRAADLETLIRPTEERGES